MSRSRRILVLLIFGILAAAGCGTRPPDAGPPPIPLRTGDLELRIVYPPVGAPIAARDSNFIFGSVADGRARLRINGHQVPVRPNGSFLAWLPMPAPGDDSLGRYEITAWRGADTIRVVHIVRPPLAPGPASALLDTASIEPRGIWWIREGERVTFRARGRPGSRMTLRWPDGTAVQMVEMPADDPGAEARWMFGSVRPIPAGGAAAGSGRYEAHVPIQQPVGRGVRSARPPPVLPEAVASGFGGCPDTPTPRVAFGADGERPADGAEATETRGCAYLEVTSGPERFVAPVPLDLWILEGPGPSVRLRDAPSGGAGRDGLVIGRPAPGATFTWLWAEGARARVTGRRNGIVRIGLDRLTEAWVSFDDLLWHREDGGPTGAARVGTVRLHGFGDRVEVSIALSDPVPYDVRLEETGRAAIILFGAYSDTNWLQHGPHDPFVRVARWRQPTSDRYVLDLELARAAWGYRARYEPGRLVIELRKPPVGLDPERPLADRTIVLDPGHPPAGATGPTGLYEGDATLAIAYRARRLLEREGANVHLTRTDRSPVRLYDRIADAERLDAEILISIHNNALPDGVNPFESHGTSVYYYHHHEASLARALQRALLRSMGLRDLGFGRADLALARPTWMPSVLTEGAFMMIPEQEAGLRDPDFQEAYARGLVDGIREFLRERAR